MLETVEHSTSGSSPPPRELPPVPLYFVLLTSSYDLLSFMGVDVLRNPVVAGIRFPLSGSPPRTPVPDPVVNQLDACRIRLARARAPSRSTGVNTTSPMMASDPVPLSLTSHQHRLPPCQSCSDFELAPSPGCPSDLSPNLICALI